jgi:hypothetical protein
MVEHAAVNRGVEGSSPSSGANFKGPIFQRVFLHVKAFRRPWSLMLSAKIKIMPGHSEESLLNDRMVA